MGGDIHAVNAHGDSIGDCAVDSASPRCLDRWIQAGGDIHQEGRRIIDRIAPKGVMGRSLPNRECMRMWIRAGGPVFVSSQTHEDDTRRADMALISIESVLHEPRMRVLWEGLHLRKDPHHTISPETVFAMCHQEGMAMAHHVMTGLQTPESIMTWAMMMEEASGSEKDRQC
jgi:hypothetical protein